MDKIRAEAYPGFDSRKKSLLYDCFSGISGDMHLGALVDLGVPAVYLRAELSKLAMAEEFSLEIEKSNKKSIQGTKVSVRLEDEFVQEECRRLSDVNAIIAASPYSEAVKKMACAIFLEIAEAESNVHGKPIQEIHFHEVGATDSIVDIIGSAICLDFLDVGNIICTRVELGGGMVDCAHGTFPVPAPATTEILKGIPCTYGRVQHETTTPTGAAILKTIVHSYESMPIFTVSKIGYGLGQKDFEIPNVLRVMLGYLEEGIEDVSCHGNSYLSDDNFEVDCNIDDMSSEAFQPLMDSVLEAGALDVYLTPIIMKKSRPAIKVSVLTKADRLDDVLLVLFNSSTTCGVRIHSVNKKVLRRSIKEIATSYGTVSIKLRYLPNGKKRWKSEYEDVLQLAREHELGYLELKQLIDAEIFSYLELERIE